MKNKKVPFDDNFILYSKCQKEWRAAVDANAEVIKIKKGQTIFNEYEKVTGIYFMVDGIVKVHKHWDSSRELIVRFAHKNDIVGHRGLASHTDIYPITVTALTDVTVCYISMSFFNASIKMNPDFSYHMMMFFADELMLSEQNLQLLANLHVKGRLARLLISLEYKFGIDENQAIAFTISRQDMASCIGTVYESVYKLLLEFIELGYIEVNGKKIILKNKIELRKLYNPR